MSLTEKYIVKFLQVILENKQLEFNFKDTNLIKDRALGASRSIDLTHLGVIPYEIQRIPWQ